MTPIREYLADVIKERKMRQISEERLPIKT